MNATNLDTAVFTAFLFQGAVKARIDTDEFSGQIGLCLELAEHARAIAKCLPRIPPEWGYPGVLAYDIIEPLGAWLAEDVTRMRSPAATAAECLRRYLEWTGE